MISVTEATNLIQQHIATTGTETLPLAKCLNRILATDVCSQINMPAFNQSGMDGYAFRFQDFTAAAPLEIVSTVAAGHKQPITMLPGQAVRIFTGAPIPAFADTVVMQEKTDVVDNQLFIVDTQLQMGSNARPAGSEIKQGQTALPAGTLLSPAAIGMLAAIGETNATVYKIPTVAIIITGNELQLPGLPLQSGNVYESNSYMLIAALEQMGISNIELLYATDDLEELTMRLKDALAVADAVLLTGGVSVGDFDFVVAATELCSVEKIFHKIKQKPGKPLFFGKRHKQFVFGLPGNPSSVLTCFYEYVTPALQQMQGQLNLGLTKAFLPLAGSYSKKEGLTHFLKASYNKQKVTLLSGQESYRLNSFAAANCLAFIPEETTLLEEGALVEVHFL